MIDSRLALFAIGALCGAVLFGWPRHSRFSRFDIRRGSHENTAPDSSTQRPRLWRDVRPSFNEGPDWRRSISHENTNPPSGPPPLKLRRSGEGGPGPTTPKPPIRPHPRG